MRGEKVDRGFGSAPDHHRPVALLQSRENRGDGGVPLQSPMGRRLLRLADLGVLLTPAFERGEPEPLPDDVVHGLLHDDFGEEVLAFGGILDLEGGVVAEPKQLVPRERVLVVLDPLEDVLLVVLFGGEHRPGPAGPGRFAASFELCGGEHQGLK